MGNYEHLLFEVKDGLAFVTVNRPEALNALNVKLLSELGDVFAQIDAEEKLRAAVLTGAGKAFVAGADIAQMRDLTTAESREMMKKGQAVMESIENIDKPVIAAINGFALGGGCELAMACDVRFASDKAKFGQPEVNLGIMPAFGGTQRLPRLVGKGMAKYLILGAEMIDAAEALRIGLVQKVFPADELLAEAEKYARLVISKSPIGLKMAKRAVNAGIHMDLVSGVAFELEAYVSTAASEDRAEGMTAFLEKRPARFVNR
ncbi:MAG: enoyl-CoA hydratase/isomerase family protein [Clostridiales Family XIII bacterium]|jgi:enoyl-CoA hydratase|nr:enoyl-CoA hydratase/isomerase family protein [Clostridiales Family XIII bacterium]